MQPVRLSLEGAYWDSLIYAGKLYLFDRGGSIRTVNWDQAIGDWSINPSLRLAMLAAFLRSDFLYGPELRAFYRDPDVNSVVTAKFSRLAESHLHLDRSVQSRLTVAEQDNPFTFPHADAEIYGRNLFVGSTRGIERATVAQGTKNPVSTRAHLHFDAPVFGLAASYGTIAAAAGDEGLFEVPAFSLGYSLFGDEPRRAVNVPCEDCHWAFQSIFATSSYGGGALVEYTKGQDRDGRRAVERTFAGTLAASDIFGRHGFAWGVQDKICLAANGTIEVARYRPWSNVADKRLQRVGALPAARPGSSVVAASAAPFGFVVEYADCLVVYPSSGEPVVLAGEPVNWRVFPRSKHYANQLHVLYDDHMIIYSFNHDYFVDQDAKLSGISVFSRRLGDDLLNRLMDQPATDPFSSTHENAP